jgi:hypothetical protein
MGHSKFTEKRRCLLQDRKIGLAASQHAHERLRSA